MRHTHTPTHIASAQTPHWHCWFGAKERKWRIDKGFATSEIPVVSASAIGYKPERKKLNQTHRKGSGNTRSELEQLPRRKASISPGDAKISARPHGISDSNPIVPNEKILRNRSQSANSAVCLPLIRCCVSCIRFTFLKSEQEKQWTNARPSAYTVSLCVRICELFRAWKSSCVSDRFRNSCSCDFFSFRALVRSQKYKRLTGSEPAAAHRHSTHTHTHTTTALLAWNNYVERRGKSKNWNLIHSHARRNETKNKNKKKNIIENKIDERHSAAAAAANHWCAHRECWACMGLRFWYFDSYASHAVSVCAVISSHWWIVSLESVFIPSHCLLSRERHRCSRRHSIVGRTHQKLLAAVVNVLVCVSVHTTRGSSRVLRRREEARTFAAKKTSKTVALLVACVPTA